MQRGLHASPRRIPRASHARFATGRIATEGILPYEWPDACPRPPCPPHPGRGRAPQPQLVCRGRGGERVGDSREITQAEYRWIEHFGHGLRANMPWWGGLDPQVWQHADPWLDWLVPLIATVLLAVALRRLGAARLRLLPRD